MNNCIDRLCGLALLIGSATVGLGQSGITITGGPGTDSSGVPAPAPSPAIPSQGAIATGPTSGYASAAGLSEERVRQIVREELQRAGLIPPAGMNLGGFGVNPNPAAPPRPGAGTNASTGATGIGSSIGTISGGSAATGVVTPSDTGAVPVRPGAAGTTRSTGLPGSGGSVGVISGGSSAVGVATPSGAGATRSGAASSTGTSNAGATGR